jgi:hypothetical protein
MPPKKSAAAPAKKKKDGSPEDGGVLDFEAQAKLALFRCNALEIQLADRTEEASKALIDKREMQRKYEKVTQDYEHEKKSCFEITQVMTRDYKGKKVKTIIRLIFIQV